MALRKRLDLYVNFRPIKMLPGLKTRFSDLPIDMIIFRENTEDLYSGIEHEVVTDVVESLKVITKTASMRIARAAFEYAAREEQRKVTAIHKANIMKMSDGLFLRCCREVAAEYPQIEYGEMIVDNACMQLVMRPETFDRAGAAESVWRHCVGPDGGAGGRTGNRAGRESGRRTMRCSKRCMARRRILREGPGESDGADAIGALMLAHIGEREAAFTFAEGDRNRLRRGQELTRDVGGTASTEQFTDAVIAKL